MQSKPHSEIELQGIIHRRLSDPSLVRSTFSGSRLQVLSPGRINTGEGPDFINSAILLEGDVLVGNSEVHLKSSDWFAHGHDKDRNYKSVILHIVLDHNTKKKLPHEILILNENELQKEVEPRVYDLSSMDEIQHYALLRLLRQASDAGKLRLELGLEGAFREMVRSFLRRYYKKQRRPSYSVDDFRQMIDNAHKLPAFFFLREIESNVEVDIPKRMELILKQQSFNEGAHLRREIQMNCFLPVAISIADVKSRIALFDWYWSHPALVSYGKLKRRFDLPQEYIWQQQGMLEFIRCHGEKPRRIADSLREYGFANVLSFYKSASAPLDREPDFDDDEFTPEWQ